MKPTKSTNKGGTDEMVIFLIILSAALLGLIAIASERAHSNQWDGSTHNYDYSGNRWVPFDF